MDAERTTRDEIAAAQQKERQQLRSSAEALQTLIARPEWKVYLALVEANADNHMKAVMRPLEHALEATKSEYAKGTLYGLGLAVSLPSAKIREAQELLGTIDAEE